MPTPLLATVAPAAMAPPMRERWSRAMRDRGEATFLEVAANAPAMLDWYYDSFYARVFHGGRIDVRTKELMRLKLSVMHGCAFCNRGNTLAALNAGVTQAQIDVLHDPGSPAFSPRERAVLHLAEQMALQAMDGELSPALYDALRAHFDDGEIVELGMTMAVLVGMAKFLFVFDLVSREANCPIGPRAGLGQAA